jgi:hypothetical protein
VKRTLFGLLHVQDLDSVQSARIMRLSPARGVKCASVEQDGWPFVVVGARDNRCFEIAQVGVVQVQSLRRRRVQRLAAHNLPNSRAN